MVDKGIEITVGPAGLGRDRGVVVSGYLRAITVGVWVGLNAADARESEGLIPEIPRVIGNWIEGRVGNDVVGPVLGSGLVAGNAKILIRISHSGDDRAKVLPFARPIATPGL